MLTHGLCSDWISSGLSKLIFGHILIRDWFGLNPKVPFKRWTRIGPLLLQGLDSRSIFRNRFFLHLLDWRWPLGLLTCLGIGPLTLPPQGIGPYPALVELPHTKIPGRFQERCQASVSRLLGR